MGRPSGDLLTVQSAGRDTVASAAATSGSNGGKATVVDIPPSPESCKSLPFTVLFYFSYFMAQLAHRDVTTVFPLTSSLATSMTTGVLPTPITQTTTRPKARPLTDVKSWGDALTYMEYTVVPLLWVDGDGGPGAVMLVNQLIGGIRLQQWRLEAVDCEGSEELRGTYGDFISSTYNRSCRSRESVYDTAGIAGVTPANTSAYPFVTQGGTADSETSQYEYWITTGQTTQQVHEHLQGIRDSRWLSTATETLTVQYAMYCGQVGFFAFVEVSMVADRIGTFTNTVVTRTLEAQVWRHWLTVFADLWFCANLAWLFGGEVFGLRNAIKTRNIRSHMFQFYRLLNWSIIWVGVCVVLFFMWLFMKLVTLEEELVSVMTADADGLAGDAVVAYHQKLSDTFDLMSLLVEAVRANEMVAFWYSIPMLLKFFQHFKGNERLAIITKTLYTAADDLMHFMLIFLLVFFNFIIGARFLFGPSLKEWSWWSLAVTTGFRALMGDFDFMSMYYVTPINATLWFFIYMTFIFILMINMLLAIVMDAYATVKKDAGKAESILGLAKRKAQKLKAKLSGNHMQDSDTEARERALAALEASDEGPSMEDLLSKLTNLETSIGSLLSKHRATSKTSAAARETAVHAVRSVDLAAARDRRDDCSKLEPESQGSPRQWARACSCGEVFADGTRFCGKCGERRTWRRCQKDCALCGSAYLQAELFCRTCGARRQDDPTGAWATEPGPAGQRAALGAEASLDGLPPQDGPALPGTPNLVPLDRAGAEKLANLQEVMGRYGVTFDQAQAERLLARRADVAALQAQADSQSSRQAAAAPGGP
mmetsp:Transcript_78644/g.222901  ORF Transcript_78644/g.222901 Transcript_78644/m.222901 type:complete len:822 (-) Transcript_78644:243-2708(-)